MNRLFYIFAQISIVCMLLSWAGCRTTRNKLIYLIPDGYVGWVCVEYEVKGAPKFSIENNRYVIKIPPTGVFRTSMKFDGGNARDEFYYVNGESRLALKSGGGWGEGRMVWGGKISGAKEIRSNNSVTYAGSNITKEMMFIGTEQQYKAADRIPGPVKFGSISPLRSKLE